MTCSTLVGDENSTVIEARRLLSRSTHGDTRILPQEKMTKNMSGSPETLDATAESKKPTDETTGLYASAGSLANVICNAGSFLSTKEDRRRVCFSNVEIREYPICAGDNPAVSKGTPITIGWDHIDEFVVDVDEHEKARLLSPRPRSALKMSSSDRTILLIDQGYSRRELMGYTASVDKAKALRERTKDTSLYRERVQEFLEGVIRGREKKRETRERVQESLEASLEELGFFAQGRAKKREPRERVQEFLEVFVRTPRAKKKETRERLQESLEELGFFDQGRAKKREPRERVQEFLEGFVRSPRAKKRGFVRSRKTKKRETSIGEDAD
jgi:hypothetical protein